MKSDEIVRKQVVYNSLKYKCIKFVCAWVLFCILVCLCSGICIGHSCCCRLAIQLKQCYMVSLFWLHRDSSMPWPFRLDGKLLPRGNVERCHSGLFTSKLFATCWGIVFQVLRLAYLCLRRVHLGFVSGAAECI